MQVKGWEKVLKFTYIQTVKSKPFIVGCIVMAAILTLMTLGINFLPALLKEPDKTIEVQDDYGNVTEEKAVFKIEKAYIFDNSGLNLNFSFLPKYYVEYETLSAEQVPEVTAKITDSSEAEVLAIIEKTDYGYDITMNRPANSEGDKALKKSDCDALISALTPVISSANLVSLGVSPEDLALAEPYISSSVLTAGQEAKSELAEVLGSIITMITSIVLFILIITYSQLTAQAIATEKSSRVMELLLTSIKPLAVIVGKVLAMTLVVLTSVLGTGALMGGLFFVTAPMGTLGQVFGMVDTQDEALKQMSTELTNSFGGIGFLQVFQIALVFIMGFLFFSLIAGLIGATVSRIEDLQTALQPLTLISVLGFYMSYLAPLMGMDGENSTASFLEKLSQYLPISSPYALPGAILSRSISDGEAFVAIGFLALCLVLFALFVAKVYEHIILYNGDRLKIKDMIKMAKKA